MVHYLTPSKICLLTLVTMYCDLPPSEASISLLTFVASKLMSNNTSSYGEATKLTTTSFSLSLEDTCTALINISTKGMPLSYWEQFVMRSWRISNIDEMMDFFDNLSILFSHRVGRKSISTKEWQDLVKSGKQQHQVCLSRSSLFGTFVRRAQVEFGTLEFGDTAALWGAYEDFITPSATVLRPASLRSIKNKSSSITALNEGSGGKVFEVLDLASNEFRDKPEAPTSYDTVRLLEFQVEEMQKFGLRISQDMRGHIHNMLGTSSRGVSLSHYARFLDAWYAGDYPSSFENLHRYYDYAIHKDRAHYQYALLNMAILQADFGCFDEAVAAMHETIAIARENKDMDCLNYSLSWLYHFRTVHVGGQLKKVGGEMIGSEAESLAFLKAEAKERKMWSVLSSTLLNEAKLCISKGHSTKEAFRHVYESSHLNIQHHITSVEAAQLLVRSSMFGRLGVTTLSKAYCDIALDCYSAESPREEMLHTRCRLAYIAVLSGNYKAAVSYLDRIDSDTTRTLKLHQFLGICTGILKMKKCLHNDDLRTAESLLRSLKVAPLSDQELAHQISLLEIDYFMQLGSFNDAFNLIEDMIATCEKEGADILHRIRLLSTKATLFAKCGRPEKGLSLALRASIAAYRSNTFVALWEAVGVLAGVLNGLKQFGDAKALVESVVYQATETEDEALIVQLYVTAADSYMGLASEAKVESEEWRGLLDKVIYWIDLAKTAYIRLEDFKGRQEMTARSTVVMRLLKNEAEAEALAKEYAEVEQMFEQGGYDAVRNRDQELIALAARPAARAAAAAEARAMKEQAT